MEQPAIKPLLGTWVIPPCFNPRDSTNKMFPAIQAGTWSTGIYQALPTDPPRTIHAPAGVIHSLRILKPYAAGRL